MSEVSEIKYYETERVDPLFQEDDRNSVLPVRYPRINECVKKQRGLFWQSHEVSLKHDYADWQKLGDGEKKFLKKVLGFFASSDVIVNKNLIERFTREIKVHEVQAMYRIQAAIEDVHSEMYALLIDTYITDAAEKAELFNSVLSDKNIAKKAAWANKWIKSDSPYCHRLVAFSAIEGIFFSGSFCAIYWLKELGILPGLTLSNDFISRDEGMHVEGAVEIHHLLLSKTPVDVMHSIIAEAVELETEFIKSALPNKLQGMNQEMMTEYIKYVANRLIKMYEYPELYPDAKQPFTFMDRIGLDNKSNFFEKRPSEYNKLADSEHTSDPYADL